LKKLHIGCGRTSELGVSPWCPMDAEERAELVARLFALMTSKLEKW
jgi:hypothetical protein